MSHLIADISFSQSVAVCGECGTFVYGEPHAKKEPYWLNNQVNNTLAAAWLVHRNETKHEVKPKPPRQPGWTIKMKEK